MRIFRHPDPVPEDLRGGVAVIGNFDGVHLGHQAVIGGARDIAQAMGVPLVVLTFEPHPRSLFQPDSEPFRLTSLRSKAHLMEGLGVDGLIVQHFDKAFAETPAEDFVTKILMAGLGVRHVMVGADFAFGKGRKGNVALLEATASEGGYTVSPIPQVMTTNGAVISSNTIRGHITDGDPGAAANLLGRTWEVDGKVVHGDARGRDLGFPTANVRMEDYLRPKAGVYAVRAGIDEGAETRWMDGAANFGTRPQFDGSDARLEVFLMDYSGDLYGKTLRVLFKAYLRAEKAFADVDALIVQMNKDVSDARAILGAGSD